MTSTFLTIIIPTKNENETLLNLLDCIERQTFSNYKVVVSDDSESDDVRKICTVRNIFYLKGGLPGKARNNGALHSDTEYFLFLDADITISDDFIEKAVSKIENQKADCISFGFFSDCNNSFVRMLHHIAKYYFFISTKLGFSHGIGGAILVKKSAHESISGFDESITVAEDHDYVKRISVSHRYLFVLDLLVQLNPRRFYKYGILKMSLKYFFIEMHRIFIGEIRDNKIPYFEQKDESRREKQSTLGKISVINE